MCVVDYGRGVSLGESQSKIVHPVDYIHLACACCPGTHSGCREVLSAQRYIHVAAQEKARPPFFSGWVD